MSRYTMPLDDRTRTRLEWGYDRPLHNVFAHLVIGGKFIDNRGLDTFITTVNELMPAIAAMLTDNNVRSLTAEETGHMTRQLIHDGANAGTSGVPCAHPLQNPHPYASGSETTCPTCGAVLRLYACGPLAGYLPLHHDHTRLGEYPFPFCSASDQHPDSL